MKTYHSADIGSDHNSDITNIEIILKKPNHRQEIEDTISEN